MKKKLYKRILASVRNTPGLWEAGEHRWQHFGLDIVLEIHHHGMMGRSFTARSFTAPEVRVTFLPKQAQKIIALLQAEATRKQLAKEAVNADKLIAIFDAKTENSPLQK